jgi:xanthine/uracil/vitamin C permease (AzgA family)
VIYRYNPTHALSAFLTVMVMPLTYSIAYGLIAGIFSFFIMEGTFLVLEFVGIPKPVFTDPNAPAELAEDDKVEKEVAEGSEEPEATKEVAGQDEMDA